MNKTTAIVLLIAVMGHFCVDMMIGVWAVFKTISEVDLAVAGLMSALAALLGEGMQLYFGHLSDKGHGKKLLIGGLAAAAGTAFLAYTHHYSTFFCLILLTNIGSGAFHPTAASLISHLNLKRKGVLITLFAAGGTLGMALSQLLFTHVYTSWNGHTALLALPILLLILFIIFAPFPSQTQGSKHRLRDTFALLQHRDLKLLYFSQVCCQSVIWAFLFFLPDILLEREYDSWIALGGGHMIAILGGTCMLVPAGYLADRYSCKTVLLSAITLSLIFLYSILYLPLLPNSALFILLFLVGATLNITNAVSVAFGNQLAPGHPGKIGGLLMGMVWCVSEGIGQGGGGLLTKLFNEDAPAHALAILGAFLIVAIALTRRLPRLVQAVEVTQEVVRE